MQLQIDVNNVKSTIFLELLNLFKKDSWNMINDYKVIENEKINTYDDEIINDLSYDRRYFKKCQKWLGR